MFNEGEAVKGCPFHIRAMPEVSAISYTGMEPCAVGSIVEVLVSGLQLLHLPAFLTLCLLLLFHDLLSKVHKQSKKYIVNNGKY